VPSRDVTNFFAAWREALVTPDGRQVFVVAGISEPGTYRGLFPPEWLTRYDVRTRKPEHILDSRRGPGEYLKILWSSLTGRVLVVAGMGRHQNLVGLYTGGRFRQIPWKPRTLTGSW
jgi:hypothetical protein